MRLAGCTTKPLASYLKAIGILRLISSPSNHVSGSAADGAARAWWEDGTFHLSTNLALDDLVGFFLRDYAPSAIIAPWNGSSGFYPKDNKDGFEPLAQTSAPRFAAIAAGIADAADEIRRQGLTEKPKGDMKAALIAALRGRLADAALHWLDATVALSGTRLRFPELLGTGGNDGHLDFTNNFMQRLVAVRGGLFDAASGGAMSGSERLLRAALGTAATQGLKANPPGQFAPGAAGGANVSVGYKGKAHANPWDFVLALEGAVLFAGAATRRHQGAVESGASFPFTVRSTLGGAGSLGLTDASSVRAEFWAPLWRRPAGCDELIGLFKEGRAVLNGKSACDGLDFARAATSLGTSRGMTAFERYGFAMRQGNMYLAAPLGRHSATSHVPETAELINDLDIGGWLQRVRRAALDGNAPGRAQQLMKRFQDILFAMSDAQASPATVQTALEILGEFVGWIATSPAVQAAITPPPRLRVAWTKHADDGSPEYRAAAALATLGCAQGIGNGAQASAHAPSPTSETASVSGTAAQSLSTANARQTPVPMAVHLAPVAPGTVARRYRAWDAAGTRAVTVWGSGELVTNLVEVLERRLLAIRESEPLSAAAPTHLDVITQFLGPDFDDRRCARLIGGLVWAQPTRFSHASGGERMRLPPFAYAALKLLFAPGDVIDTLAGGSNNDRMRRVQLPPGLIARLRGGDVDGAVHMAFGRARASGIAAPFVNTGAARGTAFGAGLDGRRLAAALLIPIHDYQLRALLDRAYPTDKEKEDAT